MKMIVQDESLPIDTQVIEHGLIEHALAAGIEPRNYRPKVERPRIRGHPKTRRATAMA